MSLVPKACWEGLGDESKCWLLSGCEIIQGAIFQGSITITFSRIEPPKGKGMDIGKLNRQCLPCLINLEEQLSLLPQ